MGKSIAILFLLVSVCPTLSFSAESAVDLIELKSGDIYRGSILESVFGKYIQIRLMDGNEKRIKWKEIKIVKKEEDSKTSNPPMMVSQAPPPTPVQVNSEPVSKVYTDASSQKSQSAQATPEYGAIRVYGGLALSDLSTSTSTSTNMGSGIRAGLAWIASASGTYSFVTGLEYIMRSTGISGYTSDPKINLSYLVIPVMNEFHFENISLGFGAYAGFGLSRKASDSTGASQDLSGATESLDYGLRALARVSLFSGPAPFAELGYDFGLGNISTSSTVTNHNRSLLLALGFAF